MSAISNFITSKKRLSIFSIILNLKAFRCVFLFFIAPIIVYSLSYKANIDGMVDFFHEGEFLVPLNSMSHGELPFKDIYIQQGLLHNAGIPYLGGYVFGNTLYGVRRIQSMIKPLDAVAIYFLGMVLFRCRLILVLPFILFICWTEYPGRLFIGIASSACFAMTLRNPENQVQKTTWWIFFSGFFSGFCFWHSLEIGIYSFFAIFVFLLIKIILSTSGMFRANILSLVIFIAGALLGFACFACYFFIHGGLQAFFDNVRIQLSTQLETWGLAYPNLRYAFYPIKQKGWIKGFYEFCMGKHGRWYIPMIILLVTEVYLVFRWLSGKLLQTQTDRGLLFLFLLGAVYYRSALGRSEVGHLFYADIFRILILFFVLDSLLTLVITDFKASYENRDKQNKFITSTATLFLVAWIVFTCSRPISAENYHKKTQDVDCGPYVSGQTLNGLGDVQIPQCQYKHIAAMVSFIHQKTSSEMRIFDFSSQAAYLFFADRLSASPFFHGIYASTPALQYKVIEDLKRHNVNLVIYRSGQHYDAVDGVSSEIRHQILSNYILTHYPQKHIVDGVLILTK
ncbi:MAG: hypothetical protein HQK77_13860 [Desulfobacterales bacterium]|nr:hypothetical protein [Desulfobacterales bacterium]